MTVSSYRDLEAEHRRAEARDRARIARQLKTLQRLERQLEKLDAVPPTSSEAIASRLSDQAAGLQPSERDALDQRLAQDIVRIEHALSDATAERHRVALTARTLMGQAEGDARQQLEQALKSAARADRASFARMKADIENIVTQRVLGAAETRQAASRSAEAQALARALISPGGEPGALGNLPERDLCAPLSGLIEALTRLGPDGEVLKERAHQLVSDPGMADFQLKLDSLCMDAAAMRKAQIETAELESRLDDAMDGLAPFDDPGSNALRAQLAEAAKLPAGQQVELACAAETHAAQQAEREDGEKARRALLEGLEELGYEVSVQQGGWNTGDRISARRPNEPNYDIQLAARADGKVQTKVRAYRHPGRSHAANARDAEVEEAWCTDLRKLHERLKENNLGAWLEYEDAPGSGAPLIIDGSGEREVPKGKAQQKPGSH